MNLQMILLLIHFLKKMISSYFMKDYELRTTLFIFDFLFSYFKSFFYFHFNFSSFNYMTHSCQIILFEINQAENFVSSPMCSQIIHSHQFYFPFVSNNLISLYVLFTNMKIIPY